MIASEAHPIHPAEEEAMQARYGNSRNGSIRLHGTDSQKVAKEVSLRDQLDDRLDEIKISDGDAMMQMADACAISDNCTCIREIAEADLPAAFAAVPIPYPA